MPGVNSKTFMVGVSAFAAFSISAYIIYNYLQKKVSNRDEGFVESPGDVEPTPKRVLILGLEGSGKSTFLSALSKPKQEVELNPQPTEGFNVITLKTDSSANLDMWEIGGSENVRKYWQNFIQDTDILVFVVDASDPQQFPQAYDEMHKLLGEPRLLNKPFIVLANKQDKPNCAYLNEIQEALGLEDVKHHRVKLIPSCVTRDRIEGVEQVRQLLARL